MNPKHRRIHELFSDHLEGKLSSLDQQEFRDYLNDPAFEQTIKQLLSERFDQEDVPVSLSKAKQQQLLTHIFGYQDSVTTLKSKKVRPWLPYVAAILVAVLAVTLIIYSVRDRYTIQSDQSVAIVAVADVPPGTNKATLTLADGRIIDLSESESGIVVKDDRIAYHDDLREVVDLPVSGVQQLVLAAPKGGTYQLTLSDGTRVWLNAGSTLTYPSGFGKRERLVELEGEAFFEVSKSTVPFRVRSAGQTVEVLGTTFNISAYPDEPATRTTLVEGSVQVVDSRTNTTNRLVPGQQSTLQKNGILNVKKIAIEQYIAWKEGLFYFQNTSFEDMMWQISRWYDVEVVYAKAIPNDTFTGTMSRNLSLMTVLELLNVSDVPNVQLRLIDKQLIVE
ncbi:iron dicitrate transporter FecR [Parapedobacter defluvii]|uniref:Iron dicitrate transporter FecR n=1 Tax=Parapedobacter defluvii TaxID=2045106 RepID=A0ABQ1LHU4_9SPHI|nr:FecR family protein [Parapedobacter defluvii]GGC22487.1 iron dicitrate transporter FecR [Parapedobacter defluvii]